jgi:secreted trypsin-like serine protease
MPLIARKSSNEGVNLDVNRARQVRMLHGQTVDDGDFPWIAALLIKQAYYHHEPRYVCSASLVSSWNIITAAHCLDEHHFRQ